MKLNYAGMPQAEEGPGHVDALEFAAGNKAERLAIGRPEGPAGLFGSRQRAGFQGVNRPKV